MGKRPKPTRSAAAGDTRRRVTESDITFSAFESSFEPGLCVIKRESGVLYLALFGLTVMLTMGTLLALTASLPRLLTHWVWLLFALFSAAIFVGRWLYPEVEACILFFLTLTLNGLLWLNLLLVPPFGVTPGALWHAFGVHGGDHMLLAQMGDVPLLGFPPLALLGFLLWEERYLMAVFHDFITQLAPGHIKWNAIWQLCSPILPFGFWAACLRPPLFADLPAWPGTLPVIAVCLVTNGPLLAYAHYRSLSLQGAAHFFDGGAVLWSMGRW